jgi:DNA-binding MarR family transcriptional regulator
MSITARKSNNGQPFRSVGFMLSTLGYAVSRRFHQVLEPLELEPSQFAVLRTVGFNQGQSQHALADNLHISPSHMVAIVDELERRGLVERRPQPGDRRVRTLHLTSVGEKLLAQAFTVAKEFEKLLTKPLDAKERAQLLDLLERIAGGLELKPGVHAALQEPSAGSAERKIRP